MTVRTTLERLLPALEQAYESLGEAVTIVDGDDRLVYVNSSWLSLYGYTRDELANITLPSIFLSDQLVVNDEMIRVAPNEKWEGEVERTRKNGEQFTAHLTVTFLRGSKGERLGRIAIVRDLSDLKNKENELKRGADERYWLAEIGRIAGSSLELSEVFREVGEKIQNLIHHDRLTVVLVDDKGDENVAVFQAGMRNSAVDRSPGRLTGEYPIDILKKNRSSLIVNAHTAEEWAKQFTRMKAEYFGGFKSTMVSPILFDGKLVGDLVLRSLDFGLYSEADSELCSQVAMQLAGPIANSMHRAGLEREAKEKEGIARIGRIISSSSDLNEVYEAFAEAVKELMPCDRIVIGTFHEPSCAFTVSYIWGSELSKRNIGNIFQLDNRDVRPVFEERRGVIYSSDNLSEVPDPYVADSLGLHSAMVIPMVTNDRFVGVLIVRSKKHQAYDESDLELADRIANQIAGAVALSQLHVELRQESNEREILANIGRVIGSSMDIDEVYEKFSELVERLIPHDRIGISMIDDDRATSTSAYVSGHVVPEREKTSVVNMDESIDGAVYRQMSGVVFQPDDDSDVETQFPGLGPSYRSGLRSFLAAPLISNDCVIGVLHIESKTERVYTSREAELSEHVAAQIAGAVANAQLYARQKKAELTIREAENKYRTIVENATDGIVVLRDRQILYANPALKVMLGNVGEGGKMDFTSFIYEEDLDMVARYSALRMRGSPAPDQYELRLKGPQGEIITVEVRPRAIVLNGEPAIVVLMRDITERKQLHEQLLQSQKMEAVGTLAGGVAHDFNNMLSAIMSYAYLLKGRLNEDETAARYLEEIQKASDRSSILTNQLLTFSRRQVVSARVINVNQIIRNLDGMFRRLIWENIELVQSLKKDLWCVKLDPSQMEQVLVNLAINARDAMPKGGKLQIETANETLTDGHPRHDSRLKPGDFVTITVSDTGIGMSEKVISRIFEPFFTTKEAGKGTGLGLSTTYGIVAESDGIIEVDSKPGEGSEFKVYLPRTLAPTESSVSDEEEDRLPTGIESILIVDDESTVRGATASVLREQGYEVLEAANGIEALEIANTRDDLQLLMTDMVMPIMSGRMLAQHFKEQFPDVKLLFMSGYTDDVLIQTEVSGGQAPFLQKPLMPEVLTRKIREVLDSPRMTPQPST